VLNTAKRLDRTPLCLGIQPQFINRRTAGACSNALGWNALHSGFVPHPQVDWKIPAALTGRKSSYTKVQPADSRRDQVFQRQVVSAPCGAAFSVTK
jgi:hypothetical protein